MSPFQLRAFVALKGLYRVRGSEKQAYALSQPARQVLYTVVSREDRYKAKNFIDTAVYRAGDQVGAWSYALVGFIGWGMKEAGIIAIVLSALWLANSLWLGKRQEVLAEQQAIADRNNAEAAATA